MSKSLSQGQVSFINLCDQVYHTYGHFPSIQKAALDLDLHVDTVKSYLKDEQVMRALRARGIDYSHTARNHQQAQALLTTEQILVANAMLNLNDKRSNREKLAEFKISTQKFQSWYSQPAFADYMRSRAETMFGSGDADAYLSLLSLVQQQDLQAVKLFMEIRGIYNPKVTHQIDVPRVVTALIETVQRHIAPLPNGPDLLAAIAQDIEDLELLPAGTSPTRNRPLTSGNGTTPPVGSLPAHAHDHTNHDVIVAEVDPPEPLSSPQNAFSI